MWRHREGGGGDGRVMCSIGSVAGVSCTYIISPLQLGERSRAVSKVWLEKHFGVCEDGDGGGWV